MKLFVVALVLGACSGGSSDDPPACITVDTSCSPGYVPTFDNVFHNTIAVSCGNTNSSCHTAGGPSGMILTDEPTAYSQLMAESTIDPGRKRIVPGNAACSLLIVRTDSPGAGYQMPIGDPLSAVERCALVQWVQNGAMNGSGQ